MSQQIPDMSALHLSEPSSDNTSSTMPISASYANAQVPLEDSEHAPSLSVDPPSSAKTPAGRLINDSFEPLTPSPRSGLSRQLSKAGDSVGSVPSSPAASPRESNLFRDHFQPVVTDALLDSPEPANLHSTNTTATATALTTNKVVDDLIDFSVDEDQDDNRNTKAMVSTQPASVTPANTLHTNRTLEPSSSSSFSSSSLQPSSPASKPLKTTAVAPPATNPADLMAKYKTKEKASTGLMKAFEKARSKFGGTEM